MIVMPRKYFDFLVDKYGNPEKYANNGRADMWFLLRRIDPEVTGKASSESFLLVSGIYVVNPRDQLGLPAESLDDLTSIPEAFVPHAENTESYLLASGHMHLRELGCIIDKKDPYWKIPPNGVSGPCVVDERFYTSLAVDGSTNYTTLLQKRHLKLSGMNLAPPECLGFFVHPASGSEGREMARDLVSITCYQLDLEAEHKLRELPVEIR
ncbi:hypothetical protein HYU23_02075 [Candidatus Woesearchaeota archaeon]|nr:hypothetical protein [Candidatus Woesearchaeota archaeon]